MGVIGTGWAIKGRNPTNDLNQLAAQSGAESLRSGHAARAIVCSNPDLQERRAHQRRAQMPRGGFIRRCARDRDGRLKPICLGRQLPTEFGINHRCRVFTETVGLARGAHQPFST